MFSHFQHSRDSRPPAPTPPRSSHFTSGAHQQAQCSLSHSYARGRAAGSSEKGEEEKKVENSFPSMLQTFRNGSRGRGQRLGVEGRVSSLKPSVLVCDCPEWISTPLLSLPWHISHFVPLLNLCALWLHKRVTVTHLAKGLGSPLPFPKSVPSCLTVSSRLKHSFLQGSFLSGKVNNSR